MALNVQADFPHLTAAAIIPGTLRFVPSSQAARRARMLRLISQPTLGIVLSCFAAAWPNLAQAQNRIEITVNGVLPPLVVLDGSPDDVDNNANKVAYVLDGTFNGVRVQNLRLVGERGSFHAAIYWTAGFGGFSRGACRTPQGRRIQRRSSSKYGTSS